jgi:tripartite-type tricarboxylate transporter receptor subunit TctC
MLDRVVRRTSAFALATVLGIALATAVSAAAAQTYPSKPIHFIIGSAPGSVIDTVTRQLADALGSDMRLPVIVENRVSAGGIVALEALKTSPPDGYALSVVAMPQLSVSPSMFKRLPYDPLNDFTHVGILFRGPQLFVVNPSVAATTLAQFVALAASQPGRLRYSSPGNGTPTHVLMEHFKNQAKIDVQHIPYKGPTANTAVLSGEVDALLEGVGPMQPFVRAGKIRALAVTGSRRIDSMPDVPTFEELGYKDIDAVWVGVIAPRGLPEPVLAALNRALTRAMRTPELRKTFEDAGRIVDPGSPQEMTATVAQEIPRWREVVRGAGISSE